ASFYLKAPTLLYVFIFIALRALRFEARFVLAAGLTAAAGWALLVLYVVTVNPEDPMITRNYVTYLTANSVLLGAEFDKII
ncbi:adenylate/guanylate cyclase domain-containing protein, partial [Tritonibacter sp. SIMBA_163]